MRQSAVSLRICRQLKGAWAVYVQFVRLPVCQSATSLPPRQVAASLSLGATMCLFAVNMLDAGFKDSILATVFFEQALSSHTLQSGLPAPCCHYIQERLLSYSQTPHLQACPAQYISSEKHTLQQRVSVTLDEIRCSSARRVRKPRLAFQQT
jgi:hypothetical protein